MEQSTLLENLRQTILLNNWVEDKGRRIYSFANNKVMINSKMVGNFKISAVNNVTISFFSLDFEVKVIDQDHIHLIDHHGKNSMKWTRTSQEI